MDNNLYRRKLKKIYNNIDKLAIKGKDNFLEYYKYIDELIAKSDYSFLEEVLLIYYQIDIIDFTDVTFVKKNTWDEICFQTSSSFLKKLSKLYKQKNVYQESYSIYLNEMNISIDLSDQLSSTYSNTGITASISLTQSLSYLDITILDSNIFNIQISKCEWINQLPQNIDIIQNINVGTYSTFKTNISTTYAGEYLISTYQRTEYPDTPNYQNINYSLFLTRDAFLGQIKEIEIYSDDINYLVKNKQYARIIGERKTFLEVTKKGATSSVLINSEDGSLSEEQNLLNRYKQAIDLLLN